MMTTLNARILARRDTTENWNANPVFIPLKGEIIVYTDYGKTDNGIDIPGIKIGDGNAYLIDLPFVDNNTKILLEKHINNADIHVTEEQKEFWDNKLNLELNGEILFLNRE